jgi:SAM-dependent methyltransferase
MPLSEQALIPQPASRADASYLSFLEGLREFVLNEKDGLDHDLDALFDREIERRGKPFENLASIKAFMEATQAGPVRNRLMRSEQEMQWRRIRETFNVNRTALEAELKQFETRGPGQLVLDPDLVTPAYANVHFHLQPGGYHKDPLAGHYYHYGTKVFFRGLNDDEHVHKGAASATPMPEDGNVERVLDVACSIGQSTTVMKDKFPDAEIWGIDHSAPMVRYAHRRAVLLNSDVNFAQRLAEDTHFPDDHFDLVYAMILFHEIPTRIATQVVAETARILRPGGVFVVHDFVDTEHSTPMQLYHRDFDSRYNGEAYAQEFCNCEFSTMLDDAGLKVRRVIHDGYGYMNTWWADRAG